MALLSELQKHPLPKIIPIIAPMRFTGHDTRLDLKTPTMAVVSLKQHGVSRYHSVHPPTCFPVPQLSFSTNTRPLIPTSDCAYSTQTGGYPQPEPTKAVELLPKCRTSLPQQAHMMAVNNTLSLIVAHCRVPTKM